MHTHQKSPFCQWCILFAGLQLICVSALAQQDPTAERPFGTASGLSSADRKTFDSLAEQYFAIHHFLQPVGTVDTLRFGRDSILIRFKTTNRMLLKDVVQLYSPGNHQLVFTKTTYYDTANRPLLVMSRELIRYSTDGSQTFYRDQYFYDRYLYNTEGKLVCWWRLHPSVSRTKAKRTVYQSDGTNSSTPAISFVPLNEFWE